MEYHFDVNAVVRIRYEQEKPTDYIWIEGGKTIEYTFFGLIEKEKLLKAGWYENYDPSMPESRYNRYDFDTTKQLIERGYNVYPPTVYTAGKVTRKPVVTVYLINKDELSKSFKTNKEAEDWIHHLKMKCGKTHLFEVIKPN